MHDLPSGWAALAGLVFLLGMRHGLDADHLAAIDGLTRVNLRRGRWFAPQCGMLFSLGHGAVVLVIALAVGIAERSARIPAWLELTGAWISISFLILLGVANLRAALTAPAGAAPVVSVKGRVLRRVLGAGHPITVALVGTLYAVSFDTVSQSVLFALTATRFGGLASALAIGALFVCGMVITDGVNGLWIAKLIARSDRLGSVASRAMGLGIALASLLTAAYGMSKLAVPGLEDWSSGREWTVGLAVTITVLASFALAQRLAPAPATGPRSG